jgi:hypothetical protein
LRRDFCSDEGERGENTTTTHPVSQQVNECTRDGMNE